MFLKNVHGQVVDETQVVRNGFWRFPGQRVDFCCAWRNTS